MQLGIAIRICTSLALVTGLVGTALAQELYWINGSDMGPRYNHVQVWDSTNPIEDAVVTLNGRALSNGGTGGTYSGELIPPVAVGADLNLVVEIGADVITATGAVPEPPILTSPVEGDVFDLGDTIRIEWTSSTNPDRFQVNVDSNGGGLRWELDGGARSLEISAEELELEMPVQISVFSYIDGNFTGPVADMPSMNIRGTSWETVSITVPVDTASWAALKAGYR